jgi:hypothetical protein
MALYQMDLFAALGSPVTGGAPSLQPQDGGRYRRKMAFTAEEMHHRFAIERLGTPGTLRPQPYLYTCVRCKWIFRLNDSRGSILALDGLGRHLAEPENSKRIVTFHRGPCPAFRVCEYLAPENNANLPHATRPTSYLSRFIHAMRTLANPLRRNRVREQQTTPS